jgi:hypothetical protein
MRQFTVLAAAVGVGAVLTLSVAGTAVAQSTYEVVPVAPGSDYTVNGTITELDGLLYFPGAHGAAGQTTLWRVDPTGGTAVPVATAQSGEFEQVEFATAADGVIYFVAVPESVGGVASVYRYDASTDTATVFTGNDSPIQELVVADGVPYTVDGTGVLRYLDPSNPAAAPTAPTPAPCADSTAYTEVRSLTALGSRVAFSGACGAGGDGELFVYDPASGMSVVDPATVTPADADIAGPNEIAEFDGDIFFAAGEYANNQRVFRYDPESNAVTETDPSTTYPGRPFLFQDRITWLAQDSELQTVIVQLDGATPARLPITSYGELLAPLDAVPWDGRLLVNGFYNNEGGGDATVFVYDPAAGAFTRVVPTGGAFIPPFVAADGTGYVVALSGPSNVVISRITAVDPPPTPTPTPTTTGAATPTPVLPATGVDAWPVIVLALSLVGLGVLLPRRPVSDR